STAAANAYVMPLASRYLERLTRAARVPVFVMLSDGGITSARAAMQAPVNLVESGPAAGAMMSAHLAQQAGWERVIAFDMGGTTAGAGGGARGGPWEAAVRAGRGGRREAGGGAGVGGRPPPAARPPPGARGGRARARSGGRRGGAGAGGRHGGAWGSLNCAAI